MRFSLKCWKSFCSLVFPCNTWYGWQLGTVALIRHGFHVLLDECMEGQAKGRSAETHDDDDARAGQKFSKATIGCYYAIVGGGRRKVAWESGRKAVMPLLVLPASATPHVRPA